MNIYVGTLDYDVNEIDLTGIFDEHVPIGNYRQI